MPDRIKASNSSTSTTSSGSERTSVAISPPDEALIVTFEARGRAVYLGLQGERGFVHIAPIPDSPPYLITVGDARRHGVIEFMLHGEHSTEIESRHLVPASDAWRAVSEFLLSGNLLPTLDWTEV